MEAFLDVQAAHAQAFQGLEVALGVCAVGIIGVLAILNFSVLSSRFLRSPMRGSHTKSRAVMFFWLVVVLCSSGAPVFAAQAPGETLSSGEKYPRFGLGAQEAQLTQGKKVYQTYCAGCHGVNGDGQGAAAQFLNPKPRNFQSGEYRFSSRASGDVPTDQDMFRSITEGLHGSSMPAWNLLPENDRWAVVAYLKTFAPDKWKFTPGPETAVAEDPYLNQPKEVAIKRGETAYHGMAMCFSCHAAYVSPEKINAARAVYGMPPLKAFRKDLGASQSMQTTDGSVIVPPDFVWNKLKRGNELQTLYHVIGNGITGTPMPTWKGILPEEDLWGIAYYVRDLSEKRPALVTEEDVHTYFEQVAKLENDRVAFEEAMKLADAKAEAEKKADAQAASVKAAAPAAASKAPEVKELPRA